MLQYTVAQAGPCCGLKRASPAQLRTGGSQAGQRCSDTRGVRRDRQREGHTTHGTGAVLGLRQVHKRRSGAAPDQRQPPINHQ